MTASGARLDTRDFLAYLNTANATNDLAVAMAAIVERRHALARLESGGRAESSAARRRQSLPPTSEYAS